MLGRLRTASLAAALTAVVLASTSLGQAPGPPGGSPPGLDQAAAVKERNAQRLLDKPGIVGIGVGVGKNGKAVIKVYKEKADVADVPEALEGVDVESVVTGIIEARAPTDRFPRPVPIGVSSGLAGVATGTLGARVTDGTNVYALSNNHVFAGINTASVGDPIIQPGDVDGGSDPGDRIGTLAAYQPIDFNGGNNTMDAAIAATTAANVGTATPADGYGTPSPVTAPASIGLAVQKYGRTTGLQLGNVAATNVTVDVCYLLLFEFCLQEARFVDQISVSPGSFSAPGDSGSLIVTQGGNQPVALLFAGGDGLTIGSPIDPVLQRFGVTIDGAPTQDGPPGAPTGVSAVPGDGSVLLAWNAPSFDGGSSLTGYRIYRGTAPGGETLLDTVGPVTSFTDTSAQNGSTYYYKVSAENANGEGPLSAGASATPNVVVLPTGPLPVLDGFNRADELPLSDSGRWAGALGVNGSAEGCLKVVSNQLASNKTTTCTAWRANVDYGPDTEVWTRIAVLPGTSNHIRLKARLQQAGTAGYDGYMLRTNQLAGTDEVYLERVDNGTFVRLLTVNRELAAGDTLLFRVQGSILEGWLQHGGAWSRVGVASDSTYAAAGSVGVGLRGTSGRLDDFGARTMGAPPPPPEPPDAPTGLTAEAGNAVVELAWQAPAGNGGSPLTGYRVYRGTSSGTETPLQTIGLATSFDDTTVTNGTTYYYKVSALNVAGEGALSNEASATPTGVDAPAEPLVTTDDFNRANELPVSDAGRWGSGANGSSERCLKVISNQLASNKSTTCTAVRTAPHGPDTEVWTRIAVLPGTNNHIRLKARLHQAGTSGYDGYMLRTNQLAGTDEVYLERIDNGVFVRLLTVNRELAAGDTVLFRVEGPILEGWLEHEGSWSRVGFASDSTYGAVGSVGIGLRGTTGRLDDFGARTTRTNPPAAPTGLTAVAGNASVTLSWTAPSFDGGSTLTGYRIYRGTSAGSETPLQTIGVATTFDDTTVTNGTTYHYKVAALNAVGEGALSNGASATTTVVVPPAEPLTTLDSFNRPDENPLAGGWGNGLIGSGESGLRVTSNQAACTRSTTCTAWRDTGSFGPNAESWTTLTTLPGNANSLRLYVRVQQPGTSGYDGYMLRTIQQSGTDQVLLERVDNGAIVTRLTIAHELAAGDTLLLRVVGSTLEAWKHDGASWGRLGLVTDSRYAAPGFTGIGLRGTTGRLDDFGARTLG